MSKAYAKQKVKELTENLLTKIVKSVEKDDEDERPPEPPPKPSYMSQQAQGLAHSFNTLNLGSSSATVAGSGNSFIGGFHPGYAVTGNPVPPPLHHASSAPPPLMPSPFSSYSPPKQQSLTMQMALHPGTSATPVRPSSAPLASPFSPSDLEEIRPLYTTPSKPRPSAGKVSSPQRPTKVEKISSSGSPSTPSTPNKEGKVQCAATTKTGKRCTRLVSSGPALAQAIDDDSSGDELEPPLERFCFQHTKEVLGGQTGCFTQKNGEFVKFNGVCHLYRTPTHSNDMVPDYIPAYLQVETQLALRIEMERSRSRSDVDGYIYTFEIREKKHGPIIKLKVGRAVNLVKRIDEWAKQCGSKEQILRGYYPPQDDQSGGQPSLMKGRVKPGAKAPCCHRLERLIHLELADIVATRVYLDPKWPLDCKQTSEFATATSDGKKRECCLDCGSMHKEIFEFQRWTKGDNENKEWERIVKPIIERWAEFVELYL
ncbi:hypothetical protein FA15DRAFT_684151 [Coprinopsis marcescibilis]|uniref:DUF1766-domain-containing protein n=1 Tax=Coprinopsis marcescibilis TaxID=230819 RepID=A0A5C3LAF0_COPMA|nr:hypothetical protein FA15DRAFT_684151 [Coprinopsis marcescibilis]